MNAKKGGIIMEVGDKIKFYFAGKEKEGVVYKIFSKTIYILTDFNNQKGKIIRRKLFDLNEDKGKKKKK
jgi:hypothetical protein